MGDFDFEDRQTFSRQKHHYLAKFNKRPESASTPAHVLMMVLKSHELFLEKMEVGELKVNRAVIVICKLGCFSSIKGWEPSGNIFL
jgi:hypothetical protein